MEKPTIRPLKMLRDNLNSQGKRSEADKVQVAIRMLQARDMAKADNLFASENALNEKAIHYMRLNSIPFGKSLKGERTNWVTNGGKLPARKAHVCQNWKGYMPDKMPNPRVGFSWDRYENGKHVGSRG